MIAGAATASAVAIAAITSAVIASAATTSAGIPVAGTAANTVSPEADPLGSAGRAVPVMAVVNPRGGRTSLPPPGSPPPAGVTLGPCPGG
jgi:hypothetical protein